MKNACTLLLCLAGLNTAFAQKEASSFSLASELSEAISGGKSQFVRTFDDRFQNAPKGSPFLYDEWLPGTLTLFDSSRTGDSILFKFDTYQNEVWIRKIGGDSIIPYSDYIRQIDLRHPDGRSWRFKKYPVSNGTNPIRFYQPVFEGTRYVLIKDEHKVLVRANFVERGVYTTGLPYDRFEGTAIEYYLQAAPDAPFQKIILKKSVLTELAPAAQARALEAFCKKEKIGKTPSGEEAARLLEFMEKG